MSQFGDKGLQVRNLIPHGLVHMRSNVLPMLWHGTLEREMMVQVPSLSSHNGSKLRVPPPNSPRFASQRDVGVYSGTPRWGGGRSLFPSLKTEKSDVPQPSRVYQNRLTRVIQ
ncbi:hypothetical protein AVEN_35129-1 [Araneus ventricosus]|uniref:Uncharacterized protein n=1 Tax=Araneus ventricosus TaxID=182803 RepID=A0A4Y2PTJ1_ARAVE|nr:hypothetical protein AVEN_35129-1 [Araneus ventricosus]